MPIVLVLALAFHVLSAVFWAGSTFTLARIGADGAAGVQGALVGPVVRVAETGAAVAPRALIGHRVASALLAVTLICMVAARYV
jgi:hypothetical protein